MAYSAIQIANEILAKHIGDGVDPLKLQKLIYYANGWWLAVSGEPLVNELPQVWRHGPVFRSIYRIFSRYQWRNIERPEPSSPFGGEPKLVDGHDAKRVRQLLDWIWEEYGGKSSVELSEETHAEGTPWRNIAEQSRFRVPDNTPIRPDEDWAFFAKLAKERGFAVRELAPA
jgi:uncharacterized phage-associated protein